MSEETSQQLDVPKEQAAPAEAGPARIEQIERNDQGDLVVRLLGQEEPICEARIARCFPWSLPDTYISVRDKDGKEVVLLKGLDKLDEATRQLVEEELRDKIFNPIIQRICEYRDDFDVTEITAETDRGKVTFQIRSRDDVRMLSATRALFKDVDGNTYEIPDLTALDGASQHYLSQYF